MSDVIKAAETVAGFVPGVGTAISAALGIADALGAGQWLTDHVLGAKGAAVASAVVAATQAATGGSTTAAAIAGLDPDKQAVLRVQLAQIAAQQADADRAERDAARAADTARIQAAIADTASARAQTIALAQAGSKLAWGPVVISGVVLVTFGGVLTLTLTRSLPAGSETLLNMMLSTLATMSVGVVSYWVGSSSGSAQKSADLANSVPIHALQAMQGGGQTSRPLAQ